MAAIAPDKKLDFPPTERTRVKRLHERGHYDRETVHAILDAGLICHVSYVIDGQPYATPTSYWREGDMLYWHGSSASRMLENVATGIPVCVTVTHLDGLVLARSGFHSSINYRAVMALGVARLVSDETAKLNTLRAFVERLTPGRWAELRPVTARELKATTVVGMPLKEVSAKVRTGPPKDDAEDYALDVWAGVLPLRQVAAPAIPDPKLKAGVALPRYLQDYALDRYARAKG
ncbi:MAG: pyridoxamine 5'-phosphate oxidase family protein [Alphaproteobacteria bacterium]|nr:pyridoxamine 5'-phosphate oxidase family protein [Alphaproteobacteria bacterium]